MAKLIPPYCDDGAPNSEKQVFGRLKKDPDFEQQKTRAGRGGRRCGADGARRAVLRRRRRVRSDPSPRTRRRSCWAATPMRGVRCGCRFSSQRRCLQWSMRAAAWTCSIPMSIVGFCGTVCVVRGRGRTRTVHAARRPLLLGAPGTCSVTPPPGRLSAADSSRSATAARSATVASSPNTCSGDQPPGNPGRFTLTPVGRAQRPAVHHVP